MVLFLRNKQFNFNIFISDYKLRWWGLPIEEHACHKTHLGDGDYTLWTSALPPLHVHWYTSAYHFPHRTTIINNKD